MEDDGWDLIYRGAGPLAAILLGIALVPLRDLTSASNFTFLFLALTIVTGELGGRAAALSTAVSSALSLDFFLTRPYLQLQIQDKHDLMAFFGLAGCGLLAAALASRGRRAPRRAPSREQLERLAAALAELERTAAPASRQALASAVQVLAELGTSERE